jgi:hypothetical protein
MRRYFWALETQNPKKATRAAEPTYELTNELTFSKERENPCGVMCLGICIQNDRRQIDD